MRERFVVQLAFDVFGPRANYDARYVCNASRSWIIKLLYTLLNSAAPKGENQLLQLRIRGDCFPEFWIIFFLWSIPTQWAFMLFASVQAIHSGRWMRTPFDEVSMWWFSRWEFQNNNGQWFEALFINEMHFEFYKLKEMLCMWLELAAVGGKGGCGAM